MAANLGDMTRGEARHQIARIIEDTFFEGTATGVTTSSLTDANEAVNYFDDRLKGGFVHIYSATTNADQERRVSANVQATGVLSLSPNWLLPTGTILYEFHKGWRIKDYNRAIDQALLQALGAGGGVIARVADTSITMTNSGVAADYLIPIPAAAKLRFIEKILFEAGTPGIYDQEVPPMAWSRSIEKTAEATASADSTQQIRIDRRYFEPIASKKLRIVGAGWAELPGADTDLIPLGMGGYVVPMAAHLMLLPRTRGQGPDAAANMNQAKIMLQIAMSQKLSSANYRPMPDAVPVRT